MPSRSIYSSHSECIPAAPKAHSPTFCRAKLSASRKLCVVIPYSFHYTLSTAETTSSRHRKHLGDRATLGKGIGINFTRHNIRECPRQRGEIVEISAGAIIQTKMLCLLGPHQTRKDTKYRIEALYTRGVARERNLTDSAQIARLSLPFGPLLGPIDSDSGARHCPLVHGSDIGKRLQAETCWQTRHSTCKLHPQAATSKGKTARSGQASRREEIQ